MYGADPILSSHFWRSQETHPSPLRDHVIYGLLLSVAFDKYQNSGEIDTMTRKKVVVLHSKTVTNQQIPRTKRRCRMTTWDSVLRNRWDLSQLNKYLISNYFDHDFVQLVDLFFCSIGNKNWNQIFQNHCHVSLKYLKLMSHDIFDTFTWGFSDDRGMPKELGKYFW